MKKFRINSAFFHSTFPTVIVNFVVDQKRLVVVGVLVILDFPKL